MRIVEIQEDVESFANLLPQVSTGALELPDSGPPL